MIRNFLTIEDLALQVQYELTKNEAKTLKKKYLYEYERIFVKLLYSPKHIFTKLKQFQFFFHNKNILFRR